MTTQTRNHWVHIALAFLVVIILGVVTFQNTMAIRSSEQLVTHSYAVRETTRSLLSSIKDMQAGQRGYLLTKEPTYLEPYHAGIESAESTFSQLRSLAKQHPGQQKRLDRLRELFESNRDHLAETIELRKKEPPPDKTDEYLQLVLSGRGQELMRDIRSVVDEILSDEESRLGERETAASARAKISTMSLVVGNTVALSLLLLSGLIAHVDRVKRDEAEVNMKKSREKLIAIVDSASDGMISFNTDLTIQLMNPAAATLHRCDASAAAGRSLLDFVPPESRDDATKEIQDFLNSGEMTRRVFETRALRDDGTEFPCEGSLAKATVGDIALATFMFRDLSEQKSTEAKIHQQTAILDQVSDAIFVCDMNDMIGYWNCGSENLYGISSEQAVGQNAAELLFSQQREFWDEGRREMLEGGVYNAEIAHQIPGHQDIVVEHRRTLIRDERGRATAQLVLSLDITDRKKVETQQRRSQRLESIGTLAGGIAHDLNNVLSPILMGGKLLQRGSGGGDQKRLADTIVTSAERGAQLIKKLLSFAGGEQAARHAVDLRDVLMEVEEILSHTFPKTIDLKIQTPDDLDSISGDDTELSQVLMNLAINARDAMPEGGRLEISLENFQVDDALAKQSDSLQPGPHVLIRIVDSGTGMSREVMDRIFDPFFTTKEQGQGTGLGLATTLGIVRAHNGDIRVYSEPGNGTSFAIYLPSESEAASSIIEPDSGNGNQQGTGEMVLIVDDEDLIAETAAATLQLAGYKVVTASRGQDAIEAFLEQSNQIDLVLLDMMMPGMDGATTKERLRAINPDVCVIASSGLRHPRADGARMADIDGFLPKPYSDQQLLNLVRKVLNMKTERKTTQ